MRRPAASARVLCWLHLDPKHTKGESSGGTQPALPPPTTNTSAFVSHPFSSAILSPKGRHTRRLEGSARQLSFLCAGAQQAACPGGVTSVGVQALLEG